jgi:hypothetical protein
VTGNSGTSDIVEPCEIQLKVDMSTDQTPDQYTSDSYTVTNCQEDTSSTISEQAITTTFATTLPSWLEYVDTTGVFTYTNAEVETWTSLVTCKMESGSDTTDTQTIAV